MSAEDDDAALPSSQLLASAYEEDEPKSESWSRSSTPTLPSDWEMLSRNASAADLVQVRAPQNPRAAAETLVTALTAWLRHARRAGGQQQGRGRRHHSSAAD